MRKKTFLVAAILVVFATKSIEAQKLTGSPESIQNQWLYARGTGLEFMPNAQAIEFYVAAGLLVDLRENPKLEFVDVSFPFVLPSTKQWVDEFERIRPAFCGETLVITSGIRPLDRQPSNASLWSVHPTGISVDLRVPKERKCRAWFEKMFLNLEAANEIDVTKEKWPAHYHVTVFPARVRHYSVSTH